jgi:hypothetical protein
MIVICEHSLQDANVQINRHGYRIDLRYRASQVIQRPEYSVCFRYLVCVFNESTRRTKSPDEQ